MFIDAFPLTAADPLYPIEGITIGSVSAKIYQKNRNDLCVWLFEANTQLAGVFTQNRCCAAPVLLCREHLRAAMPRALLINAGCANAATGHAGYTDARTCCEIVAKHIACQPQEVLPFSTGVILERLPMEKMHKAIPLAITAAQNLSSADNDPQTAWKMAAHAILTTDTVPKIASACKGAWQVTGIAKGSGMIHPNMATMLGFIGCNARITQPTLQKLTQRIAHESFNTITIDGDTSTNDSFVIACTQKVGACIDSAQHPDYPHLYDLILQVAQSLAEAIVRDGEGATKFVRIHVQQAKTQAEAIKVAEKVALSPLVKTSFFASDPNLGRILSAVGNADIPHFDFSQVGLSIGHIQVAECGGRASGYDTIQEALVKKIMENQAFDLTIRLGRGQAEASKITCDLSYDYIKINADYRT